MFTKEYQLHYRRNWQIAYPLVLGQAGHMITNIADTIMIGQLGSTHLAGASIAHTVFILLFVFAIGIVTGVTPLVGKAYGEKDIPKLRMLFKNGLLINSIVGVIITGIMYFSFPVLYHLGQEPEVVNFAVDYYKVVVFSMLPFMVFLHYKQFVDGLARTKPGMVIIIVCNIINVILNYGLIFGNFGLPRMEIAGAAIATVIARLLMAISFIVYMRYDWALNIYIKNLEYIKYEWSKIKDILRIGIPIGLQYVFEVGAFAAGAVMTGWLGATSLAAHQIVISLAALTYLMSSGVASAATVRISNHIGERKYRRMRIAGYSAFVMVVAFMTITGIIFIIGRNFFPMLYIDEKDVLVLASSLMVVAGLFQILDGIQVTALGALRGMEDVRKPTLIAMFSYWGLMLPACYFFGFIAEMGVIGIWVGYLFGLFFASIILLWRFVRTSSKIVRKKGFGKERMSIEFVKEI